MIVAVAPIIYFVRQNVSTICQETAIRMQQINSAMVQTVKGMSNAMKNMQVEQIASTMQNFEKQFEDMDVRSGLRTTLLVLFYTLNVCMSSRIHGGHDGVYDRNFHAARGS